MSTMSPIQSFPFNNLPVKTFLCEFTEYLSFHFHGLIVCSGGKSEQDNISLDMISKQKQNQSTQID